MGSPSAAWSATFTCHSGALASWSAWESPTWWRPLAAGGPTLRVVPVGGLFRFEHSVVPPVRALGLTLAVAAHWDVAWPAMRAELQKRGRVVIAGDAFRLPWHRATYQAHHASRWFLLSQDQNRYIAQDPMAAVNDYGRFDPTTVQLTESELANVCRSVVGMSTVTALREQSSLGVPDAGVDQRYRWLKSVEDRTQGDVETLESAAPSDGIDQIHVFLAERAGDPAAYRQADDLWHAVRQREFVSASLTADPWVDVDPAVWEPVLERWRSIPPLLMYARLLAESGRTGHAVSTLLDTLQWLAEAEAERAGHRFPTQIGQLAI